MPKPAPRRATSPYLLRPRRSLDQARTEVGERAEPPQIPEGRDRLDNRAFASGGG